MVVVARPSGESLTIERKRLELIEHQMPSAKQPYHAAKDMQLPEARTFLDRCASATQQTATSSLRQAIAVLTSNGYTLAGSCVLLGSGRPTDDLAATLRSHAMIHTAEGHFFRNAVQQACESCRLPVLGVKEKELVTRATETIDVSPEELQRRLAELGKRVGPPWRQDEKLCTIAGWLALASSTAQLP